MMTVATAASSSSTAAVSRSGVSRGRFGPVMGATDRRFRRAECWSLLQGTAFEAAFCQMYALPSHLEALLPMPEDGGHWSALHSWVMPTPSFVEFVMFARSASRL